MTSNISPVENLAVKAVRDSVEAEADWDVAESAEKLHFYIILAAQNVGRFEPYTADEIAMNAYLTDRMAGKRLCDYAWRILAASRAA